MFFQFAPLLRVTTAWSCQVQTTASSSRASWLRRSWRTWWMPKSTWCPSLSTSHHWRTPHAHAWTPTRFAFYFCSIFHHHPAVGYISNLIGCHSCKRAVRFCLSVVLSLSQSALLLSYSDSAIYFSLRQQADSTEMKTEAILSQTRKQIIEIVPLKWAAIELSQRVLQESRVCAWDIEISEQNSHSFCVFRSHLLLALSFSASSTQSFSAVILW